MGGRIGDACSGQVIDEHGRATAQNSIWWAHADTHAGHGGGWQIHDEYGWHAGWQDWSADMRHWASEHWAGVHISDTSGGQTHENSLSGIAF